MKISLIAIGKRMPSWIIEGYETYAKRLPPEFKLQLIEINAEKRTKNSDIDRILTREGGALLQAVPPHNRIIALERNGKSHSTQQLANKLNTWQQDHQDISLLIGGPEGISPDSLHKTDELWSLSDLTLPHPLVRVLLAEQIYRAWSILAHHPYHR